MEQYRFFLVIALVFVVYLMFEQWQQDYGPKPPPQPQATGSLPGTDSPPAATNTSNVDTDIPAPESTKVVDSQSQEVPVAQVQQTNGKTISIKTDVLELKLNTVGGELQQALLLKYPVSVDSPAQPYDLMDNSAKRYFTAHSGFQYQGSQINGQQLAAGTQTVYQTDATEYVLQDGKETLEVNLRWRSPTGVEFIKQYIFKRNSYDIKVNHIVNNASQKDWQGRIFLMLKRTPPQEKTGAAMLPTYAGPVYYSPEHKYKKVTFDDIDDAKLVGNQKNAINESFAGGWFAFIEHYFMGAWLPPKDEVYQYYTQKKSNGRYIIAAVSQGASLKPNETLSTSTSLYVGPKIEKVLEPLATGLELSIDFGWLTILAKPLFWILDIIHGIIGNWGWAIIFLTILIKLAFYKLSEASYKSMANMRRVAPRMKQINERYADDRQKKSQALMELYKKEKINPLGGCLPILIQIPVFIALYYVLLESVELRQAEWILWITDLSIKDPYFVLPIIMGASMIIQQKLNPAPLDPMQAKIMMILPIVFTFLFLFFPSGLVLYWVVNNLLSILQQWYITKKVVTDKKPG